MSPPVVVYLFRPNHENDRTFNLPKWGHSVKAIQALQKLNEESQQKCIPMTQIL
jgi:hypothetical protein